MRAAIASLITAALVMSIAGTADAASKKRKRHVQYHDSGQRHYQREPGDPQRRARTFDSSQYFERDSGRIPFGTLEWWDQKTRETNPQ